MTKRAVPSWLPNAISVVRVLLVPVWVACAEAANSSAADPDGQTFRTWAAIVLVTIGISDVLDGWLARRFDLQSPFGAIVDAAADKLAQVVLFTYLALCPGPAFAAVPLWFLVLLIARDALLVAGYLSIRRRHGKVDAEHRAHGKIASLLLFALLVAHSAGVPATWRLPLLYGSAAVFLASTLLYVRHGIRQFAR